MQDLQKIVIETKTSLDHLSKSIETLNKDTATNLKVAMDALALSQELNRRFDRHLPEINERLSSFVDDVKDQTSPIWNKLEKQDSRLGNHEEKLNTHSGNFKWLAGIWVVVQIFLTGWLKFFN